MDEFFTTSKVLEISFDALSAAAGLFVVATALRVASAFTLSAHRQAMQVLAAAAVIVVVSEIVGITAALTRPSTLTDAAGEFAELVAILAAAAVLHYLRRVEREEISPLRRSADVDELTGLSSRSFFERAAGRRVEQARKNGTPLACILLDVDDFKAYNDCHGHGAGDEILRCLARVLRESARADDLVGRYGGEEFVLLVNGEVEVAREVAERIREAVQSACVPEPEKSPARPTTVSLGVVPLSEETRSLERLIAIADAEMYRSKKTGKNRVSVFANP
ncbi:MAG TPA: GGDEF domain-containing protein [Rubrobacter sp.]|nr:GGDEF domain-containing protein [Rubrobacter sp.]